ncbi:amino acid permease [Clostridium bornimense]|uniref:APC family permease n=1 Tax=Clostridium bornimense TaxID=1216932 RepID=UPI001C12120D|nr:amino acid permease [Clostridium bornimense]MBU5315696.1 amino acid permease [Clostridium bornimense]
MTNLKKQLGFKEALSITIGVVIGEGIFFKASSVFNNAGSPTLGIAAWIIAGIITICCGLSIAEVSSSIPRDGGLYGYLKELYNETIAYLYGWVQNIIYYPALIASASIIFSRQVTYFIDLSKTEQKMLSISLILFFSAIHILSTKTAGKLQIIFTAGKLIPIFLIIIIGIFYNKKDGLTLSNYSVPSNSLGFGSALLSCLWAYDGWISVGNITGEMKNPEKDLPKAIILGLSLIMILYVSISFVFLKVLGFNNAIASNRIASDVSLIIFGKVGATLITIGILVSVIGAFNGNLISGSRISYTMANDKLLPFSKSLSKVSKFNTPIYSIILTSSIGIIYVLTGTYESITNICLFSALFFFLLGVTGVFILRKRDITSSYKTPLYPIVPIIGILGGSYVIIDTLFSDFKNASIGILITLLGYPVYVFLKKNKRSADYERFK